VRPVWANRPANHPLERGGPRLVVGIRTYRAAGYRRWTITAQSTSLAVGGQPGKQAQGRTKSLLETGVL
jgi:hypothetical protein